MKLPIISSVKTQSLASTKLLMGLVDWMVVAINHYNLMGCSAMWCWKIISFRIWILYNHSFQMRQRTPLSKFWAVSVPKQSHMGRGRQNDMRVVNNFHFQYYWSQVFRFRKLMPSTKKFMWTLKWTWFINMYNL